MHKRPHLCLNRLDNVVERNNKHGSVCVGSARVSVIATHGDARHNLVHRPMTLDHGVDFGAGRPKKILEGLRILFAALQACDLRPKMIPAIAAGLLDDHSCWSRIVVLCQLHALGAFGGDPLNLSDLGALPDLLDRGLDDAKQLGR